MKKLGILLIVMCATSVSFGWGSFNTWVTKANGDPAPFLDTDNLTLWIKAYMPYQKIEGIPTYSVVKSGNIFSVTITVNNVPDAGNVDGEWDLSVVPFTGVGPLAGPLLPGQYAVVLRVNGNYYNPYWPGFTMPTVLGAASHYFTVTSTAPQPSPWPWPYYSWWWYWCCWP